jgi:lambda repressor-like predicted transcriptional regulator
MEEDWDKDGDAYKDVYREDIVAGIKALGINLKKNVPLR